MSSFLQDLTEGKIDFAGQQRVDNVSRIWLVATSIISFILGIALQSLQVTFGIFAVSTIVLIFVVIPPWPMFNRNPVTWLSVSESKAGKTS